MGFAVVAGYLLEGDYQFDRPSCADYPAGAQDDIEFRVTRSFEEIYGSNQRLGKKDLILVLSSAFGPPEA